MSYCVNCGVELAKSEHNCPLCGTEIINPGDPWREPRQRPYPAYFEAVVRGVDRRYFCFLVALALMIPMVICILVDIFSNSNFGWSLYVAGAITLFMVVVLVPIIFDMPHPFLFLLFDVVALLVYLRFIDVQASGPSWFLPMALPIVIAAGMAALAIILYYRLRKNKGILVVLAVILFATAGLSIVIDIIIKAYLGSSPTPQWSWYVLVPCLAIGIGCLILNKRKTWKEKVRKRLFF